MKLTQPLQIVSEDKDYLSNNLYGRLQEIKHLMQLLGFHLVDFFESWKEKTRRTE